MKGAPDKPGRVACCVPFCRRTAKRTHDVQEVICGKHYRAVPKTWRRGYRRACREFDAAFAARPTLATVSQEDRVARAYRRVAWMWGVIKKRAIEAAMGI